MNDFEADTEGLSGATIKRPGLFRCLKQLKPGDTLYVWKLDRLGRSVGEVVQLVLHIERKQGKRFVSQGSGSTAITLRRIDTSSRIFCSKAGVQSVRV